MLLFNTREEFHSQVLIREEYMHLLQPSASKLYKEPDTLYYHVRHSYELIDNPRNVLNKLMIKLIRKENYEFFSIFSIVRLKSIVLTCIVLSPK